MMRKRAAVLQSLVERFHPEESQALIDHLSNREQAAMREVAVGPVQTDLLAAPAPEAIAAYHPSWIEQALEKESQERRPLYQAAIDGKLPPAPTAFLLGNLINLLGAPAVVPLACLATAPLQPLIDLDARVLARLVGYLGMIDLAGEMKKTIESRLLREVEPLLAERQQQFLQQWMQESDPMPGPRHGLAEWIPDFQRHAQQSGLIRLGRALSHHDKSFVWHLAHRFDAGRGRWILRHAQETVAPKMAEKLVGQVETTMEFLHLGALA